ncbi:MAG: M20/M25/M40 family metallo-hydrolase [Thermofilaceae archaeon]
MNISLLASLAEIPGPSGFESRVKEFIVRKLAEIGYNATTDHVGNLYVTLGRGRPMLVIAAHMDEVGLLVKYVEDSGFLRIVALGGLIPNTIQGCEVTIMGEKGDLPGVIGATPPHVKEGVPRELTVDDLYIDIGASSREEAFHRGVTVGSPVAFSVRLKDWGDFVASKALDDRIGCYTLLEALKEAEEPEKGTIVVAFTVQEEVGLRGASALAHWLEPDFAIAVEGTIANDTPGTPADRVVTRIGLGPALRVMDRTILASQSLLNHVKQLAVNAKVPYQLQISPYSGTDAGGFLHRGAAITAISVPVRYIHAPVSLVKKCDVDNTVSLIKELLNNPWPK